MQENETDPGNVSNHKHADEEQEKEGNHPFDNLFQRLFAHHTHDKEMHTDGRHEERELHINGHEDTEVNAADVQLFQHRVNDRHHDQDFRGRGKKAPHDENSDVHHGEKHPGLKIVSHYEFEEPVGKLLHRHQKPEKGCGHDDEVDHGGEHDRILEHHGQIFDACVPV